MASSPDAERPPLLQTDVSLTAEATQELGTTRRRFVVLALYALYGMCNQFQYVCFGNIVEQTRDYFATTSLGVNALSVMYAAVYIAVAFPAMEGLTRIGLRRALLVGAFATALGAGIKVVAAAVAAYWVLMLGQFFAALGQIFFLSVPPLIAATWFPVKERSMATTLGTMSAIVGMSMAFGLSPLFIHAGRSGRAAFLAFFIFQAAWGALAAAGILFFVPDEPALAPSVTSPTYKRRSQSASPSRQASAEYGALAASPSGGSGADYAPLKDAGVEPPQHIFAQLWALRFNAGFFVATSVFGVDCGSLTVIGVIAAQVFAPFGITEGETGSMTAIGAIVGIATSIGGGVLLDKYRRYRAPLIASNLLQAVLSGLLVVCLHSIASGSRTLLAVCYTIVIVLIALNLPTLPMGLELSVELTYPVDEQIAATVAVWVNSIVCIVGTLAASAVLGDTPSKGAALGVLFGLVAVYVGCAVALALIHEHRHRYDAECAAALADGGDDDALPA